MDNNPETLAPLGTQKTGRSQTIQNSSLHYATQHRTLKRLATWTLPKNSDTVFLPFLLYINNLSKKK